MRVEPNEAGGRSPSRAPAVFCNRRLIPSFRQPQQPVIGPSARHRRGQVGQLQARSVIHRPAQRQQIFPAVAGASSQSAAAVPAWPTGLGAPTTRQPDDRFPLRVGEGSRTRSLSSNGSSGRFLP